MGAVRRPPRSSSGRRTARVDALGRAARASWAERLNRRSEGETLDIAAAIESAAPLSGLRSGFPTRIGAVLRHAGARLATRTSHWRLALLTDGEPWDVRVRDPRYLTEDARQAAQRSRGPGVEVFCIALGSQNVQKLVRIFETRGFVVIERLSSPPEAMPLQYFNFPR